MLTGASGFIGSALASSLTRNGTAVKHYSFSEMLDGNVLQFETGYDVCIHLAARVHVMNDRVRDPLAEFRRCNVAGTVTLARQAAEAGIRRFVYISSIKVNGESTAPGTSFKPTDAPATRDPYGISKHEAESALHDIGRQTGMEITVIRPPLVYGPGVKANFAAMMRLIYRGVPLPIGCVRNKRSLVGLDNLISLIELCTVHPAAANQTFLVSDGIDLSTPDLARRIGDALGKPARLVPIPESIIKLGMGALGKADISQRLCESLQVDISVTRNLLGWTPPVSIDAGLRRVADSWVSSLPK